MKIWLFFTRKETASIYWPFQIPSSELIRRQYRLFIRIHEYSVIIYYWQSNSNYLEGFNTELIKVKS